MSTIGTFYGVGVGPGDPELLTLKAVRVLREVDVIFAAGHERNGKSLALDIVTPHLPPGARVESLNFPHTFDSVDGRSSHFEAAGRILDTLRRPMSAAFLTLGDPMTFSTFTYVLDALSELEPAVPVRVVPGVTSFAAAAAATLTPLAEGDETLTILGASRNTEALEAALKTADNLVIMKPYRQTERVCDLLQHAGLADRTMFCTECSRPTEKVSRGLEEARTGKGLYMSLFLVRKKGGKIAR
jgi:precorrin-2/cobalt-factor-2 C20-methyltransferase